MKKILITLTLLVVIHTITFAQKWIDTTYSIQLTKDIAYGSSIDFAGTTRTHLLNICVPTNDIVPTCGRPLLLAIHGGAFLAGNKDGDQIPLWVSEFAKRGYTTASINYRLGMFQTNSLVNCNVSLLGFPWNCLNMQDTSEWYRGAYRGMQDAKGALRYLIAHASQYQIDPRNVFIVGESAGAFIALETAFLDDSIEKYDQASALNNVSAPNSIYENQCIQTPGFATNIAAMQLNRPELGSIEGDMNTSTLPYQIKGVGSFYGAMFKNLFTNYTYTQAPVLYMYHQPNDLVVPYDEGRVESGVSYCATQFPFNCQYLINLPMIYGSKGIKKMIDNMAGSGIPLPTYHFDTTTNFTDCVGQLANPSLAGHSVDNSTLRSKNMAILFATAIDTSGLCTPNKIDETSLPNRVTISPNPISHSFVIHGITEKICQVEVFDFNGRIIYSTTYIPSSNQIQVPGMAQGNYFVKILGDKRVYYSKLVKE